MQLHYFLAKKQLYLFNTVISRDYILLNFQYKCVREIEAILKML